LSRVLTLALTVTLVASSCSSGSDDTAPPAPGGGADERSPAVVLQESADATIDIDRASVVLAAELDLAGRVLALDAAGRVDYAAVVADVTFGAEQDGQAQELQVVADGETAWIGGEGAVASAFPDGARYVSGDAAQLAGADSFGPVNLVGVALVLRGATDVEAGQVEEIDGVETRTYTTTITFLDAVEAAGDDADAFRSALNLTGDAEQAELDIEVAIGPDDVVRRLELVIDGGDLPVGGTYDLTISDVGDEVEVPQAPPADQVATGPEADALFERLLTS